LKKGLKGDIDLFKLIHYNPNHKENKNLKFIDNKCKIFIGYKNKKPVWNEKVKEDIVIEHLDKSEDIYLKHMVKKGRNNVTNEEISHWKEIGAPTYEYRKKVGNNLVKVIKRHS